MTNINKTYVVTANDNLRNLQPGNMKNLYVRAIGAGVISSTLYALCTIDSAYAAAAFDLTAAGKAMFNPVVKFIDAWYGTGIFASGVGGAVVAAGDLRTRAMGFGIGAVVSGLVILGVKAGFGVKEITAMIELSNFA